MSSALAVRGLCARYGHVPVVEDLDLTVERGEIVALLGRNGAGKTTTLMALGGFLPRTEGEVEVNGRPVTGPAHRRTRDDLGIVLEGRSVFSSLTTAQNLQLGAVDVQEALDLFPELEPRLGIPAGQLSGGEQQMLSLARAMCRHPAVLLIDELSFGLAPIVCDRLFGRLREYVGDRSMSVLLVEQHVHYAAEVADRALVMHHGSIALELAASELHAREAEIEQLYLGGPEADPKAAASGGAPPVT